jgi:hypothetical protein
MERVTEVSGKIMNSLKRINMKKLLFSFAIVFLFLSQAFASEWRFEELEALNNGCLETASERIGSSKAFEYCGCTTSRTSQLYTVEEIVYLYETDPNFLEQGSIKEISNYCNEVIK